jgi:hypothetical protein
LGAVVSVTANITGGNILTGGLISAASTVTGTSHLGAVVSVTANITGGNILTGGLISATGNITGNVFIGNGSQLTGLGAPKAVTIYTPSSSENLTMFFARNALTILEIRSVVTGTTPSVTYSLVSGADRSVTTTTHVSANVVTSTTTGSTVTLTNTTIAANTWVWLTTSATSGTVNSFNVTISV